MQIPPQQISTCPWLLQRTMQSKRLNCAMLSYPRPEQQETRGSNQNVAQLHLVPFNCKMDASEPRAQRAHPQCMQLINSHNSGPRLTARTRTVVLSSTLLERLDVCSVFKYWAHVHRTASGGGPCNYNGHADVPPQTAFHTIEYNTLLNTTSAINRRNSRYMRTNCMGTKCFTVHPEKVVKMIPGVH
jgi:hypothetical protein